MAKKSIIAGEFIIQIADNGHVDVVRIFRSAWAAMEGIAKEKGLVIGEKWNTQTLGRHLVNEYGDGKVFKFNDITIIRHDDNRIEIYQECANTYKALCYIAEKMNFTVDQKWNTQSLGNKLTDYLSEHKDEADKILVSPNSKRKNTSLVQAKETKASASKFKHTYKIEIDPDCVYQFCYIKLNVKSDKAIENKKKRDEYMSVMDKVSMDWAIEDLEYSLYPEEADIVKDMIKGNKMETSDCYFAVDNECKVTFHIFDENDDEIATLTNDDILTVDTEQQFGGVSEDEEDEEKVKLAQKYIAENNIDVANRSHVFKQMEPGTWNWLNVMLCCSEENRVYLLETDEEFDPKKLAAKDVTIEEFFKGEGYFEMLSEILYDGKILTNKCKEMDWGPRRGYNYLVKMNQEGTVTENVFELCY